MNYDISKFRVGDKVYYIALEKNQIVIIPCEIDTVCFTILGIRYFVNKVDDEVCEFELYDREDKKGIISRIEDLSEELC